MYTKYGKYLQKDLAYFISAVLNAGSENEYLKLAKLKNDSLNSIILLPNILG